MTEPIFKAPLPPSGGESVPPAKDEDDKQKTPLSNQDVKQKILPYLWYILGGVFLFGIILGVAMGGGEEAPQVPECRLKYKANPDIQEKLNLCGVAGPSDPCVLYIMNETRYEKKVEDFFKKAEALTERSDFAIKFENTTYSKLRIPPGYFAEIKIPSLR